MHPALADAIKKWEAKHQQKARVRYQFTPHCGARHRARIRRQLGTGAVTQSYVPARGVRRIILASR